MTGRTIAGISHTLAYNAENQLVSMSGGTTATKTNTPTGTLNPTPTPTATPIPQNGVVIYTYDGDGNLVKSQIGDEITLYPNMYYELQGQKVRKYYFAGSERIAVRENSELTWLLRDHLGSTSVTVNSSGSLGSVTKYTAFGETRGTATTSTDYLYTSQRQEAEVGLYFYKARFYDLILLCLSNQISLFRIHLVPLIGLTICILGITRLT